MRLNMGPSSVVDDKADGWLADAISCSQLLLGEVTGSDSQDICCSEFGLDMAFASAHPATFGGFGHVLGMGAKMQMCGLAADGPITVMQNIKAMGWSAIDAIGNDVCFDWPVIHAELSIALATASRPVPASFGGWIAWHEPAKCFSFAQSFWATVAIAAQGVAMSPPTVMMGTTESVGVYGEIAVGNRTCHKQGV